MIIKYDIQKKYIQPEIHICSDAQNLETKELYDTVSEMFEQTVRAYREDNEEAVMIRAVEIVRVFAANKQVFLSTEAEQYRVKERLYEMEAVLGEERFVRISNSEIVNVKKIRKLDTSMTGTIKMYLKGGSETFVSRRYVTKIKHALGI